MKQYIPFTQQPYCCVPTSLQMVMYRRGIPLVEQEELAYALGLAVPEEDVKLFAKARSGERPSAGWGTQIYKPEFEINKVLSELSIPLSVELKLHLSSPDELRTILQEISDDDEADALLCFDYGKLWDLDHQGGHVCVFERNVGDTVHIIDPERNVPKRRNRSLEKLYEAIDFHGPHNSCGVWIVRGVNE